MKRRVLSLIIAVIMILGTMGTVVFAEEQTGVAKIGETEYATFGEAMTAAKSANGAVEVEIYDKVTLNQSLGGSYSTIKFVGKDTDAEIYLDVQGYITASEKIVAFEDLKLSKSSGGFITNAGFMNVAFGVCDVNSVSYKNCVFSNGAYASRGKTTFTNCTFYRSHDKYGLWAYGNVDCTVDCCTFADYRGIKMYAEGAAKTVDLTVKNTDFSAVDNKPAIVLTYGESVTLENNTYSSTGVFELDLDGAPNGTPVTSDVAPTCKNDNGACGVLVDGKIYTTVAQAAEVAADGSTVILLHNSTETVEFAEGVTLDKNGFVAENVTVTQPGLSGSGTETDPYLINNIDGLKWFRDDVNNGNDYNGKFVKLTANIDLNNEEWTPIGYSGKTFKGNFDGGNNTVKNLKITKSFENVAANNGIGFFGRTDDPATICNLTIENVDITGSLYVGAVAGCAYTGKKIENCTVKGDIAIDAWWYAGVIGGNGYISLVNNCHVIGNPDSYIKGNDGSYIGGIWGFRGEGGNKITNCTVTGISISGVDRVGGISGIAHYGNTISDSSITNVTITATDADAKSIGLIAGANLGSEKDGAAFVINNEATESSANADGTPVTTHAGIGNHQNETDCVCSVVGVNVTYDENGKITGGTFESNVSDKYVAEGYELTENADGTYSVDREYAITLSADGGKYADGTSAIAFNAFFKQWEDQTVDAFGMYIYKQSDKLGRKVTVDGTTAGTELVAAEGLFNAVVTAIPAEANGAYIVCLPYVIVEGNTIAGEVKAVTASQFSKILAD